MQGNTQISDAFRKALVDDKHTSRDETVVHAPMRAVVAALEAALAGHVVVPEADLAWLFGEGPDADGKWFGETIGDGIPKLAGKYPRTYWWRSHFRAMISAAPPAQREG